MSSPEALRDEVWLPAPAWEGLYEVSSLGRVRSVPHAVKARWDSERMTKACLKAPSVNDGGYLRVTLSRPGWKQRIYVHRLVAMAFHGPPSLGQVVCHNNGDQSDNRAENLRWGTPSDNARDQVRHGTHHRARALACPAGHPFKPFNISRGHAAKGQRACRACDLARKRVLPRGTTIRELADLVYSELEARHVAA